MNILINNKICPCCNNRVGGIPGSDYFTWDSFHDELYCNKCGLVVINNELPTIAHLKQVIDNDKGFDLMMDKEIDAVIGKLASKGFFRDANSNVMMYNGNGFHEIQKPLFERVLKDYLPVKEAQQYWLEIYNKLPKFPKTQYNGYLKYIELCSAESVDAVFEIFMETFYRPNDARKKEIDVVSQGNKSSYSQLLINNDVFITPNRELLQFDADNKAFIPVNESNIGTIIDCNNPTLANDILEHGKKTVRLTNIFDMVSRFETAKRNEELKAMYEKDYRYIDKLFETFN